MITINLISPEQKQKLEWRKVYHAASKLTALIFIFTVIVSSLLWGADYFLKLKLADILAQNAPEINKVKNLSSQIKLMNQKIEIAQVTQQEYQKWSPFIINLSQLTPTDISFEGLMIYQQDSLIEIKGTAKTRDALINYQKILEGSGLFKKVDVPLESLIEKENNTIDIKAVPDFDKIKNL